MKKKTVVLAGTISLTMAGLLLFSSFFNTQSFKNTYIETTAQDNAVVAEGVVNQLEYALKYGKTLDNYYGIDAVFEELYRYCGYMEQVSIVDREKHVLYEDGTRTEETELFSEVGRVVETGEPSIWTEGSTQHILLPVRERNQTVTAALSMSYSTDALKAQIDSYVGRIYINALLAALAGVALFLGLFFVIRKNPDKKRLSRIIVPAILLSNLMSGMMSYGVFRQGYLEITRNTAGILESKIAGDIGKVVSQGVPYEELYGIDGYFQDILKGTEQMESVRLETGDHVALVGGEEVSAYTLPADSGGRTAVLVMTSSKSYIESRLKDILINLTVTVITSLMIAAEVIAFVLSVLTTERKKGGIIVKKEDRSFQPLGIVRGLSFLFAMFQYMAMAFVSIVLASIYRPVVFFGYEIPYDLVMSLPLSIQILTSLFTAWLSGKVVQRFGWKPVAVTGMLIMAAGTVTAAGAAEPYLFLFAQVIIGTGLGLAKTSFDIYAVLISSGDDMELYTSNANAGIIVGMSCSSAIGAVIAGAFGYGGAYLVMGAIGCLVTLLVVLLGQNVVEERGGRPAGAEEKTRVRLPFDTRFFAYLLFMVLPYFFIMMFVDYFFPVYANGQGMTTETIGYVFLAYGICTSYVGVWICNLLSKRFGCVALMTGFLGILGVGIFVFSARNVFFFSVVLVMTIAVADGVMPSQQFKYLYSLPFARKAGFSKAVSMEGIFSSAIRGVAPMIFGCIMMRGNTGLLAVAALIILCAAVFWLVNVFGRRKEDGINEA